ncbi:MAG: hypothetical protein GXO80_00360 [Chlorobi bacterium]|nr:hypothetical protein [Chlorobiota bacterium]
MEDKTKIYFEEIIKDLKIETPSKKFTDNVMKQIYAEFSDESVLKLSFFNKNKFLIIFSVVFLSIFLIIIFFSSGQPVATPDNSIYDLYLKLVFDKLKDFFNVKFEFFLILRIIFSSVFILYLADFFISKIQKLNHSV